MSRVAATRRPLEGRAPHAAEIVVSGGQLMFCLGRTATGAWTLLPIALFGTPAARGAVVRTDIPPTPVAASKPAVGRPPRDRRGAWTRG